MPNEVTKNDDGTVEVKLETGEIYKGDPIDVMNQMGTSYVSGKRWTQNIKAENENLKNQQLNPPAPPPPAAPSGNADERALQDYLLDQQGKALGFKDGAEYRKRLEFINNTADRQSNEQVATDFMLACPEFTGEPDAVEKLAQKVEQMGWEYTQPNLMAAHLLCVRQGAYKVLTMDEVNMAANERSAKTEGRTVPPPPPQGGAPGNADQTNPWAMSTDELRKKVLEGGGLGKALMEMPTGGSMG